MATMRKPPAIDPDTWVMRGTQQSDTPVPQISSDLETQQVANPNIQDTSNLDLQTSTSKVPEPRQLDHLASELLEQLDIQPADKPASRRSRKPARRGRVVRADGRELVRLLVYLPPDIGKALTLYCAVKEMEKSEIVTQLLRKLLSKPAS